MGMGVDSAGILPEKIFLQYNLLGAVIVQYSTFGSKRFFQENFLIALFLQDFGPCHGGDTRFGLLDLPPLSEQGCKIYSRGSY